MVPLRFAVLGFFLVLAAGLLGTQASPPEGATLVLRGGLIHTQTAEGSFVGSLVIRDGKVVAVSREAEALAGATIVDVSNCVITPGLIDAHGMLGLHPSAATESGREAGLNILDAVDPFADDWRDAARQGITAVYAQPAGNGSLGGSGAVLRVGPTSTAEELALRSPAGVQMALGLAPSAPAATATALPDLFGRRGGAPAAPAATTTPPPVSNSLTRYAQFEQLRGQFEAAKRYGESKPVRPDLPKELLLRTMKSDVPVRIEIHHEDDLRNALQLASEFGLRAVFERIERARPLPEELGTSQAALVVGPFLGVRPSTEVRKLALDGRRFALGTFGSEPRATAGLRLHAAAAIAGGYPRERVLRALTSDAAELLGVGDRLGRIAPGRSSDLVVFAGDPLDPSAPVRLTISQGRITYDNPGAETAPLPISAQPNLPEKLPSSYVLRTTRLLTSAGNFAPGELHVVEGRLTRSNGSPLPIIDLGDAPVTPGLVAAHLAMTGEALPDADAAHLKATDGLALDDGRLRGCRDAGFLTALVAPGSSNVIAGVAAVVRAHDSAAPAEVSAKFVLTGAARSRERYPASLAGQVELIQDRLRGVPGETHLHLPPAVRTSLLAERDRVLSAVHNQQLAACFEVQSRAEVRAALRLITEHKLRGTLLLSREVDDLTDEIQQSGVAVVVGPLKPPDSERTLKGLLALGKQGVPLAFGGDAVDMRASAAWLVNAGLPRQTALRALIGQPSTRLGLPEAAGRLLPGDAADFVIWTGDPLDTASRPAAVMIQGQRLAIGVADDTSAPDGRRPTATPARSRGRGR